MIITICGSVKFREEIDKAQIDLTLKGHLVFTVENLKEIVITKTIETQLARTHFKKIDQSDAIYVVNVNGYIGESTAREIEYAKSLGKEIFYLENK